MDPRLGRMGLKRCFLGVSELFSLVQVPLVSQVWSHVLLTLIPNPSDQETHQLQFRRSRITNRGIILIHGRYTISHDISHR